MEQRIIQAAKQVFIEKGYAKAGMSDIAVRVGINRSGLHYYFRTKEKMFEAVFADIVLSFIPSIHNIILQDKPIPERIAEMVDVYFEVLRKEPCFPVFITQEIQRDATHLFNTISSLEIGQYASRIKEVLHTEMKNGTIKNIPIEFIFYTFYGLIVFPFLVRPLTEIAFGDNTSFGEKVAGMERAYHPADGISAPSSRQIPIIRKTAIWDILKKRLRANGRHTTCGHRF